MKDALLHVILEPSRATVMWLLVFAVTLGLRHHVIRLTEWIAKSMYKS